MNSQPTRCLYKMTLGCPTCNRVRESRMTGGSPAASRGPVNTFQADQTAAAHIAYPELHHLTMPLRAHARENGDTEQINLWAGQGTSSARDLPRPGSPRSSWPKMPLSHSTELPPNPGRSRGPDFAALADCRSTRKGGTPAALPSRRTANRPGGRLLRASRSALTGYCVRPARQVGLRGGRVRARFVAPRRANQAGFASTRSRKVVRTSR